MSKRKDRCCSGSVFVTAPPCGYYPQSCCNYPAPYSNCGCNNWNNSNCCNSCNNNGCADGFGNNAWWLIILLLFGGFGGCGCGL